MSSFTNYISYEDPQSARPRIGHYDLSEKRILPLSFVSGTRIDNLYQVIEAGEANIIPALSEGPLSAASVKVLPPLTGRDILCVGKNYAEHAREFNSSGFDSSDKVDQPSHPVIFTKRYTSIIADGDGIFPHPDFTQTADYEGEIGVIIGKPGYRISEASAMDYVWGYTIINDVTARERQRDHKQFYIGKSPDTFCPMGPIAVPASKLDKVLRVQTRVNGELRQDATTNDLIFSVPCLIRTMSEGQTLMPGDVLATGTPAGVGIGRKPPVYLREGDTVAISVTGLGTLTNKIASPQSPNPVFDSVSKTPASSHLLSSNTTKVVASSSLTIINGKPLHYKALGISTGAPIVFVHGLGGSSESWTPLIQSLNLEDSHTLHLLDLEGHGLSPTTALSKITISSFSEDLNGVFEHAGLQSGVTVVSHSMGSLIAIQFAIAHPSKVKNLILLGPPASPLPAEASQAFQALARQARTQGLAAIVDTLITEGTSEKSRKANPLAATAVRLSILGQDPEGYAKACSALAEATDGVDTKKIKARTLIITGSEDQISPPSLVEKYASTWGGEIQTKVLEGVGHWHTFEDPNGAAQALSEFMS